MEYPSNNNSNSNGNRGSKEKTATQQLIKQNVDFLIQQLEAGHSDALTAYLTAMNRRRRSRTTSLSHFTADELHTCYPIKTSSA